MEEPPASWRSRLKRWRWWIAAVALRGRRARGAADRPAPCGRLAGVRGAARAGRRRRRRPGAVEGRRRARGRRGLRAVDCRSVEGAARGAERRPAPRQPGARSAPRAMHRIRQARRTLAPAPAPGADGAAPASGRRSPRSPIVAFKRFAVELRYWPLFSKTIQLRDVALDAPRVALDRLASGDLNVMALVPKSEVAVEAGATPGAARGRRADADGGGRRRGGVGLEVRPRPLRPARRPAALPRFHAARAASRSRSASTRSRCRRSRSAPACTASRRAST